MSPKPRRAPRAAADDPIARLIDADTERAVLTPIVSFPDTLAHFPTVTTDDFYHDAYRRVFKAVLDVKADGLEPDLETVRTRLRTTGNLAIVGPAVLEALLDRSLRPAAANCAYHARRLCELAQARRYFYSEQRAVAALLEDPGRIVNGYLPARIDELIELQRDALAGTMPAGTFSIGDAFEAARARETTAGESVPFGVPRLDRATRGVEPGEVVLELGRTASLKTMFFCSQLRGLVRERPDHAFMLVTLEMPRAQVCWRLLRMETGRTDDALRTGLEDGTVDAAGFCTTFRRLIFLDEGALSLAEIEQRARQTQHAIAPTRLAAIFIDHAGLVRASSGRTAYEQASEVGRGLKQLARRLETVVFAIVQANRAGRSEEPVALESARDSGCFEENADFVLSFSSMFDAPVGGGLPGVKLRLTKNRRGPNLSVTMLFNPLSLRMAEQLDA